MYSPQTDETTRPNKPTIVDDFMYGNNVANSHVTIRLGFIRKVYGILAVQLAFTTLVAFVITYFESVSGFIKANNWLLIVNIFAVLIIMFALMMKKNDYPANYYLLGIFTFCESISIGTVTSLYDSMVVVQALFLTMAIVGCLTLYTFQSKRDFKAGGALLFSLLTLLMIGSFMQIFFQSDGFRTALSVLGAFVFSGFIIVDTQMIMKHLHAEEYIVGVINLYLDIINLFLEILKILDAMKRN